MGTIPSYPPPTRPLDGSEELAGWQDGKQVSPTAADVAALATKQVQGGTTNYAVSSGSSALTATIDPVPLTPLAPGFRVALLVSEPNATAPTLTVNGQGPYQILLRGAPLAAGKLLAGVIVNLTFDGTAFQVDSLNESFPDAARRVGHIADVVIPPDATDDQVMDLLATAQSTDVNNAIAAALGTLDGYLSDTEQAKTDTLAAMAAISSSGSITVGLGGGVTTDTNDNSGVTMIVGVASRALRVTSVHVKVSTVGTLKALVLNRNAGASFTMAGSFDIPSPSTPNSYNDIDVSSLGITLAQGQYLALASAASGGARVRSDNAAPGYTAVAVAGVLTGTATFSVTNNKRICATFTGAFTDTAVDTTALSVNMSQRALAFDRTAETITETIGYSFPTDTVAAAPLGYMLGRASEDSVLKSFTAPVANAGPINIILLRHVSGESYETVRIIPVTAITPQADNTWTDADFGLVEVPAGYHIGYWQLTGGASIKYASVLLPDGAGNEARNFTPDPIGTNTWLIQPDRRWGGMFTLERRRPVATARHMSPTIRRSVSKPIVAYDQAFGTPAAASWTFTGAWAHSAAGAQAPAGAGDMSATAKASQVSLFADEDRTLRWEFIAATGMKAMFGTYRTTGASVVMIDDSAGQIGWIRGVTATTWTTVPVLTSSVPLPALTDGRAYRLELDKDRRRLTFILTDLVTGLAVATQSVGSNEGFFTNPANYLFGSPFFANFAVAQPTLQRVTSTSHRRRPRVMMCGDSKTAIYTNNNAVWLNYRWSQLTKEAVGGDAVISAIAGALSAELSGLLVAEIPAVMPDWIILYYGTNDQDSGLATFQANYNAVIAWANSNNAKVAVCILPPMTGRTVTQLNNYMLSLPNSVRKIRLDLALSLNNDGVTFNPAMFGSDPIHESVLGQQTAFERVQTDVPELFDYARI